MTDFPGAPVAVAAPLWRDPVQRRQAGDRILRIEGTPGTIGPVDAVALFFAVQPEAGLLPGLWVGQWVLLAGICAEDSLNLSETTSPRSPLLFPGNDRRKLGGVFMIDPEGVARYEYHSARPEDQHGWERCWRCWARLKMVPIRTILIHGSTGSGGVRRKSQGRFFRHSGGSPSQELS